MEYKLAQDNAIELFMSVDQPYYVAGKQVSGYAYLIVTEERSYQNLQIVVRGLEHVEWPKIIACGNDPKTYKNSYESYHSSFILHRFNNTILPGQYQFPFTFRLSSMMPGSFTLSSNCFIQYTCSLQLNHAIPEQTQSFSVQLNIIEPPRSLSHEISVQETTHSKCCGYCLSFGVTKIIMKCDKSFLVTGQPFRITCEINHQKGETPIFKSQFMLYEKIIMISDAGQTKIKTNYSRPLFENTWEIKPGETRDYTFQAQLPQDIYNCTAIGKITARYFVICFETSSGFCAKTPSATLHIIVHSKTPQLFANAQIVKPQNWFPQLFSKVTCLQMKPYLYQPLKNIPYLNLPGQGQEAMTSSMNNSYRYQPYYPNSQQPVYPILSQYDQNAQQQQQEGYPPNFQPNSQTQRKMLQ